MVIPSTHKLLGENAYYNYGTLYSLVAEFRPDLVGVEIRQEDLGRPDNYLRHNYPEEMIALAQTYRDRTFGFDWLGTELSGRAIPDDWWTKQSRIKQLEQECGSAPPTPSPAVARLIDRLDALSRQRDQIIETATAASLAGGHYDRVAAAYYQTAAELARGTHCEVLVEWYTERDNQIAANILSKVKQNPGHRISIITGADHHGPVIGALSQLGSSVVLVPVRDGAVRPGSPR
jgi:hypothetical protein